MHIESLGYSVYLDESLQSLQKFIKESSYTKVFVLVDINTGEHCLPLLQQKLPDFTSFDIIEIDPGEENKNIDFCIGVWSTLIDFGADRKSLLINLGGGVVTDMGGFAASTFKRGFDFVHVPTTLLSQVDASVGGKTGIDMNEIKNVIGTFTQPKAVFICTEFLNTLVEREWRSGFAEMIKHGLIRDIMFYNLLKNKSFSEIGQEEIRHSIYLKNQVVMEDPKEMNLRKILNFGHTIGHALEGYSLTRGSNPLLHGEAIAVGMICEAYISHKATGLGQESLEDITQYILSQYPKDTLPAINVSQDSLEEYLRIMKNDKKNEGSAIGFALLKEIGQAEPSVFVEEDLIKESILYYNQLQ